MKLRGRRAARVLPMMGLALLLLSGCGELTPGTAAVVNGTRISSAKVSDLADAQCDLRKQLAKAGQAPGTSAARVRQDSLSLLMDAELSRQFGQTKKLTPDPLLTQGFLGQVVPLFKSVSPASRTELTDVFTTWSKGRAILVQAGSAETGQPPSATNTEQLLNAGLQSREGWLKKAAIETDPRYSPDKRGFPGRGDGSVSHPGSDFAKAAGATELDPKWLTGLPAGQRCG